MKKDKSGKGEHKVAYLGPEGTFSHKAVKDIFTQKYPEIPCATISNIFEKVVDGEVALGVVPVENSSEGLIQETLDNLVRHPIRVVGSYKLPIHLCLLARTNDMREIKIIKSHPQPLAQSRGWLSQNFPTALLETESSSVKAILSTMDTGTAFIANKEAAEKYGLKILAENIEDKKSNATQFYVIAQGEIPSLSKALHAKETALLLAVYDRPGVLRDILSVFADHKLNLSKLHSKVSEAEGWDYYFFLEVEAPHQDSDLQEVLKEIKHHCSVVRVLGTT